MSTDSEARAKINMVIKHHHLVLHCGERHCWVVLQRQRRYESIMNSSVITFFGKSPPS